MRNWQKIVVALVVIGALGISFASGVYLGRENQPAISQINSVINKEASASVEAVDFAPFWEAWKTIDDKFVPTGKAATTTSNQKRVWGAIQGLASSLGDPYTVFFPPDDAKIFESEINGNFSGVGMEVGIREGVLVVVSPLKGSPAERAGLKPGDKIIKIDNQLSSDFPVEKAVKLIRGKEGTVVKLTVLRNGDGGPKEFSITRETINIPTVDTEVRSTLSVDAQGNGTLANGVFVLRLYNFSVNSADLFRQSLREFALSGTNKLVLDLRGNPGGYLEAAVDMASWFLPVGKVVVSEDFGKKQEPLIYRSKGYNVFNDNLKMTILIDGGSASAAEILAGALKEHGVAKLVGEQTFGKGSVQELIKLTPDTSFKVTIARWLTPNGKSISENGLIPDVAVKPTEKDVKAGKDVQLDKAIELLNN
ncbi:MAG: S41 family peptidase [Candidatus Paceibacterota bacterium]